MNKKKFIAIVVSLIVLGLGFVCIRNKTLLKITHPRFYKEYVETYSKEFGVDKSLVYSVIKTESKFNKNAISRKEAKGLMQISEITQKWAEEELELTNIDIYDAKTNIRIGCWYISKLFNEFGDLDLVVAAYNGGSGNVSKWLKDEEYSKDGSKLHNIPFNETKNYLKKVKESYKIYKVLYGEEETNEEI
ncbi:MAG: lytic transglycosylase domain-containing protein [Paraclostridium sp.]